MKVVCFLEIVLGILFFKMVYGIFWDINMDESDINKIEIKFYWLIIFYYKLYFEMFIICKNYWFVV